MRYVTRVATGVVITLTVFATWRAIGGPAALHRVPAGDTLFVEDFESGSLDAWHDGVDPKRHQVVTHPARAHSGERFLRIIYPRGQDGGWLTRFLDAGYDSLYVSYFVRFPGDWEGATKLVVLYGSRTDDRWSALGKAGKCPNGADFFATSVVTIPPGAPGRVRFYTYYPAMRREPDGVTCWGRHGRDIAWYADSAAVALARQRWHRIEFWVRLNAPAGNDGIQKVWLDGELVGEWPRLTLRAASVLALNAVQLSASMPSGAPNTQWLYVDDMLVMRARPGALGGSAQHLQPLERLHQERTWVAPPKDRAVVTSRAVGEERDQLPPARSRIPVHVQRAR